MPCDVEAALSRVLTQYRESPILLGIMRAALQEVCEARDAIEAIPDAFDLNTSVGEQLTFIGRALGVPREHCVCEDAPVFGFECESSLTPVAGFCEGVTWRGCGPTANTVSLDDEELRRILKARLYQVRNLIDAQSLTAAAREVWGGQTMVFDRVDEAIVAPLRPLDTRELLVMPIAFRVLPIAFGVRPMIHLGNAPVFGFGDGFAGLCPETEECFEFAFCDPNRGFCPPPRANKGAWLCPQDPRPYSCA